MPKSRENEWGCPCSAEGSGAYPEDGQERPSLGILGYPETASLVLKATTVRSCHLLVFWSLHRTDDSLVYSGEYIPRLCRVYSLDLTLSVCTTLSSVYLYICISVYPVYRYILWWTCQASPPFPPSSFSLPLSLLDHSPSLSRLNNADHQKQIAVRDRCCSTENAFLFRSCTSHDSMVLGHGLWTGPFLGSTQDG